MTPNMRLIDVNGLPHELTEFQVRMMITIGWLTFVAAWVMNICFYKTHPSSVDFSLKRFKEKMFIYIFGKKYSLICSLGSSLGCTTCSDCCCTKFSRGFKTCSDCCCSSSEDCCCSSSHDCCCVTWSNCFKTCSDGCCSSSHDCCCTTCSNCCKGEVERTSCTLIFSFSLFRWSGWLWLLSEEGTWSRNGWERTGCRQWRPAAGKLRR